MRSGPNPLLVVLYWAVRAYQVLLIVWALLTWIPPVQNSVFFAILSIPVLPIISVFNAFHLGAIGFGVIIVMFLLNLAARWLQRQIAGGPTDADFNPNDPTRNDRA